MLRPIVDIILQKLVDLVEARVIRQAIVNLLPCVLSQELQAPLILAEVIDVGVVIFKQ